MLHKIQPDFHLNMKDYDDFPPCPYFLTVLKHYPESAYVYITLWNMADDKNCAACSKSKIRNQFLISKTLFRNKLLSLVDLGLISVTESNNFFDVELIPYDEDHFEESCT